jgi:hypothetical protein
MSTPTKDDLDSGLRFLHVMGMQTRFDLTDQTVRYDALLEELVSRGLIDLRSLDARRERARSREAERNQEKAHVQVAASVDKYALENLPDVDCKALHPICKGRCCTLSFPLSFQDLDERVIRWDYGRPYVIAQRPSDGYCTHSCETTRACTVYENRPAICRSYDCRDDKRIWLDFEKRIPAPFPPGSGDTEPAPMLAGGASPALERS